MIITLSPQEAEQLRRIVREYYMELRAEIYHTDSSSFKRGLKNEQAQLETLLEKLEPTSPWMEQDIWKRA